MKFWTRETNSKKYEIAKECMSSKGKENETKRKKSNTGLKYGFKLPTSPGTK